MNDLKTPTQNRNFRVVMEGIKRSKIIRQKQAPAFKINELKKIFRELDVVSNGKLRDKALLLLGFTGAFSRAELVAFNVNDLTYTEEGLIVSLAKSKTNQYGDYEEKAIFYSSEVNLCSFRTLQSWIGRLEKHNSPLFVRVRKGDRITSNRLTDTTVNDLVKAYFGTNYSAHSPSASFINIAKINGADNSEIMRQSKHKTSAMILRYTRIEYIKKQNGAMKLSL